MERVWRSQRPLCVQPLPTGGLSPAADGTFSRWVSDPAGDARLPPVLVELDGEVRHVLQGFVGEVHLHVDVPLAVRERPGDLQAFGLYCRQPDLKRSGKPNGTRQDSP